MIVSMDDMIVSCFRSRLTPAAAVEMVQALHGPDEVLVRDADFAGLPVDHDIEVDIDAVMFADRFRAGLAVRFSSDDQRHLGLGDWVAAGLDAIGITKERVKAIVGGDCGCDQRQEALNEFGRFFGMG